MKEDRLPIMETIEAGDTVEYRDGRTRVVKYIVNQGREYTYRFLVETNEISEAYTEEGSLYLENESGWDIVNVIKKQTPVTATTGETSKGVKIQMINSMIKGLEEMKESL